MAEVFGSEGQSVEVAGEYSCPLCGHRRHFAKDDVFAADHHPGHPWTLMVADGGIDALSEHT